MTMAACPAIFMRAPFFWFPLTLVRVSARSLSGFVLLCLAGLCLLVAAASSALAAPVATEPGVVMPEVEVQDEAGRWVPTTLPYRWRSTATDTSRRLTFRLRFDLPAVPTTMWAMRADRMPPDRQLTLNGQLLSGALQDRALVRRFALPAQWVDVPPALLRAGSNELLMTLELSHRVGALAPVTLGPADVLQPEFSRLVWFTVSLPQALNMAAAGLALFILLIWWLRPAERVLGYFGALWLLVSVRNMAYFVTNGHLPPAVSDYLFYAAQVFSAPLVAGFALAIARRPWPLPRAAVVAVLAPMLLIGALGVWLDRMVLVRQWVYPCFIVVLCWVAWLLWQGVRQLAPLARRGMAVALGTLVVAAVHDYLYATGGLPYLGMQPVLNHVMGTFWVPWVSPLLLLVGARVLLQRFVQALDLSEHHGQLLEQRVADRTRELQAANAAKTRFVAAASHDLRQPVASIGLLAGLLREQVNGSASRAVLDRLTESVAALESLLKGLLDMSRFDAGSVQVRPQRLQLQSLFDAVAAHERDAAALKGLQLRLHASGLSVQADPVLLEQMVRNLVSNAVRYTERGGVLVSARRRGDGVLLQVWDTGCGVPDDKQASIFEEFVQLDNPARERHRGLGLGLSLVRRASQLMAVPLSLRSVPGKGSCFSLMLPRVGAAQRVAPVAPVQPRSLRGMQIVVVDDDEGIRESLRLRIETWGARVQCYGSVAALRDALQRQGLPQTLDLVLSDQRLPDGHALDVLAVLQPRWPDLPALIITGDTAPADLARLQATGLRVLHKPFSAEALFDAMREVVPGERG